MIDFSSLLQVIPAVMTGMKGKDLKAQKGTSREMQNLARAQYDLNSPVYKKLYEQNRQAGEQDLASSIAEIGRQNRKLVSMGRNPLLSQERGGEQVFRNLIMGQNDVGRSARADTTSQIRGGQDALSRVYSTQGDLTDQDYQNKLRKVGSYYSIGDALKGLFGLGGSQGQPYEGEVINWNAPRVR